MQRTLILGSTSRYRRELLSRLQLPFEVHAPDVDETPEPGESPRALAERLALEKAKAVARRFPEAIVIGSDQVADLAGEPLGKPGDHDRATAQLRRMRGQDADLPDRCRRRLRSDPVREPRHRAGPGSPFVISTTQPSKPISVRSSRTIAPEAPRARTRHRPVGGHRERRPDGPCRFAAHPHGQDAARRRNRLAVTTPGKLYLVPAPLDFGCDVQTPLQDVLPLGTLRAAAGITHWICENAKSARAYLKRIDAVTPLVAPVQEQRIQELPRDVHKKGDHAGQFDAKPLLANALAGHDIGLLSEAGMPAVADPGSSVARAAHDLGIAVIPLVGPVSLLLALAASGLNGQNFAFVGYLPQDADARTRRIRELEDLALKTGQTQLFIETPYRNTALFQALLRTLQHNTRLAIARGLTLANADLRSDIVKGWRAKPADDDDRAPAVFAIGR